jgi:hypothetical protein
MLKHCCHNRARPVVMLHEQFKDLIHLNMMLRERHEESEMRLLKKKICETARKKLLYAEALRHARTQSKAELVLVQQQYTTCIEY